MIYVWSGEREKKNSELTFTYTNDGADTLELGAADFFRVFGDGNLLSYGPERTAQGYARLRRVAIKGIKEITVVVTAYNVPCYGCDLQLPYFGARVTRGGVTVAETTAFSCHIGSARLCNVPRYSFQRGFLEVYDYTQEHFEKAEIYEVEAPTVIDGVGDTASYETERFFAGRSGDFTGFDEVRTPWWQNHALYQTGEDWFSVERDLIEKAKSGFRYLDFSLSAEKTGFLRLEIDARTPTQIFAVFDEILPDGKWIFRRSDNNDCLVWTVPAGKRTVLSAEPYALLHLKIVYQGDAKIVPSLVKLENATPFGVRVEGDESVAKVFTAAENTYRQNALDNFTDCPGRERAGWLCDSYFTARAERLFTGENAIEKNFLENYILGRYEEIPNGMIPDCFPAQHPDHTYIPNWAMWFIIQLHDYLNRTHDRTLIERAKEKAYGIVGFLKKFENELGLLENLEGWVFVEWSICNDPAYVQGVNFPSNMTYALACDCLGELYGDEAYRQKAASIRKKIKELSFNGAYFVDNAVRKEGVLTLCADHISETCQYYALFTGIETDAAYRKKMKETFGPSRAEGVFPEIGRSNMFIGNYLRFFWLCAEGEYERVLEECLPYFASMSDRTGTLWEKDEPTASCNHGFASVAAVLIAQCLTGYVTVEQKKPIFLPSHKAGKKYGVSVIFDYGAGEVKKDC